MGKLISETGGFGTECEYGDCKNEAKEIIQGFLLCDSHVEKLKDVRGNKKKFEEFKKKIREKFSFSKPTTNKSSDAF